MKKLLLPLALGLGALSGCASAPQPVANQASRAWITPVQAILLAADAAPRSVHGTFAMRVQSTGVQGNSTFLNSELDYRDQRNLTVALGPRTLDQLWKRLGADPLVALKGRNILVTGSAIRTKIYFFVDGEMTDKYYYQTHVNITDASELVVE